MKKYAIFMIVAATITILSACASSKDNCPAYSQNAQQTEQLAQR